MRQYLRYAVLIELVTALGGILAKHLGLSVVPWDIVLYLSLALIMYILWHDDPFDGDDGGDSFDDVYIRHANTPRP